MKKSQISVRKIDIFIKECLQKYDQKLQLKRLKENIKAPKLHNFSAH